MALDTISHGDIAWIGLAAYIAAYDGYAVLTKNDTMSMSFYRALKSPKRRWPTVLVWSYITIHLFKFLPDRFDPLRRLGIR